MFYNLKLYTHWPHVSPLTMQIDIYNCSLPSNKKIHDNSRVRSSVYWLLPSFHTALSYPLHTNATKLRSFGFILSLNGIPETEVYCLMVKMVPKKIFYFLHVLCSV